MRTRTLFILIFSLFLFSGCEMFQKRGPAQQEPRPAHPAIRKAQNSADPGLNRDLEMVRARKASLEGHRSLGAKNTVDQNPVDKMTEEQFLYSELVHLYEQNKKKDFDIKLSQFNRKFPHSSWKDELLYLRSLLSLAIHDYGRSLQDLNQLLKESPRSNRAVSALFAKGVVYRRMNLPSQAKLMFENVLTRYPGSPEALRAKNEIQIIR